MAYRNNIVLQVGPIAAQVNLESALVREESLKTVCIGAPGAATHVPTAIRQRNECPDCKNDDKTTFRKARVDGDTFQVLEQSEVANVAATAVGFTKSIIQVHIHDAADVAAKTQQDDGLYYLTPSKPELISLYGIIVDLIKRHPQYSFLCQYTPSSRVNLYQLRVHGESTLVLEARARTGRLKILDQPDFTVPPENQAQVDALLPTMVEVFDAAAYEDKFRQDLEVLIASKTAETGVVGPRSAATAGVKVAAGAVDLTSLLSSALTAANVTPQP